MIYIETLIEYNDRSDCIAKGQLTFRPNTHLPIDDYQKLCPQNGKITWQPIIGFYSLKILAT